MIFNQRPANVEAHAHAVGLRAEKRREQLPGHFRWDTNAAVRHFDDSERVRQLCRSQHGDSLFRRQMLHRLARVSQEIDQHLLDHDAVGEDKWQVVRQLEFAFERALFVVTFNEFDDVGRQ